MHRCTMYPSLALWLLAMAATQPVAAADAANGKLLYQQRCMACHSVKYNGVGPAHQGVFGRQAGLATAYDYSAALKASGLTWTETNLDRWLSNPEALVPGQKMGFSVPGAAERADLIAYLKTLTP